jgi:hypothetical protein
MIHGDIAREVQIVETLEQRSEEVRAMIPTRCASQPMALVNRPG